MAAAVQEHQELLTPQQMLQVASYEHAQPETDPTVLRVAAQLSWMASQHHLSEYNLMKNGPKGAAAVYIPLSILLPAHVKELRVYQLINAQKQAWWISARPRVHAVVLEDPFSRARDPNHAEETPDELQEALSLAMESPLPPPPMHLRQPSKEQTSASAKTSDSHPINMSPMVPFDLLFRLHIYLRNSPDPPPPTYLHLPYELTLDALTAPNQQSSQTAPIARPPGQITQPSQMMENGIPSAIPAGLFQADIMQDMPTPPPAPHTSPKLRIGAVDAALVPLPPSPETLKRGIPTADSENATTSTPASNVVETPSYFTQRLSSTLCNDIREATSSSIDLPSTPQRPAVKYTGRGIPNAVRPTQNGAHPTSTGDEDFRNFLMAKLLPVAPASSPQGPRLGNLMLSSCPGKKVRLDGPVKGRGTICRDLGRDLQRIRDSGVGCIVCCLDDSELHFLGAPWEDYAREASQLGIDILRIPTPEGFAPLDPAALNSHIDNLINQYTLQSVSILVHCRGGVGRAGLIACCWMLKMGLCGWIRRMDFPPVEHPFQSFFDKNTLEVPPELANGNAGPIAHPNGLPSPALSYQNGATADHGDVIPDSTQAEGIFPENSSSPDVPPHTLALVRLDTMDVVERVIRVVRRRRSVKAIETFEQVHFLVRFVEFLRNAHIPPTSSSKHQ